MVDVSAKSVTTRVAIASGMVSMAAATAQVIREGTAKKGDVLAVARLAGISASKWTSHLIPLCHAIPIEAVTIEFQWQTPQSHSPLPELPQNDSHGDIGREILVCRAQVTTSAKTGVEMEAMTAVSLATLTVYDMVKSIDREIEIGPLRLEEKSGGKSGHFKRD